MVILTQIDPNTPKIGGRTPPAIWHSLAELRVPLEIASLALHWPFLPKRKAEAGQSVMLLPGFATGEQSMVALKHYLESLGYHVEHWGLGKNQGNVPKLLPLVIEQVNTMSKRRGRKIHLIGWSLGGYLAREVARDHPELVHQVITMGSPIIGGPKYTSISRISSQRGLDLDAVEQRIAERYNVPITVPLTVIYSPIDGVVPMNSAIDHWSPTVTHHKVWASHLGMGFHPQVLKHVAETLGNVLP